MMFHRRVAKVQQAALEAEAAINVRMKSIAAWAEGGDQARARQELGQLLQENAASFWAHYLAGALYVRVGDTAQALVEYAIALALAPDNPLPYKGLGWMLRRAGRAAEAKAILDEGWRRYQRLMGSGLTPEQREQFFGHEPGDA